MYKTKYFTLEELAHPQIINAIGEINTWRRLDPEVLQDLDYIREEWYLIYRTGVYCNRLKLGIDSRGLRPPNDEDGSFYSTHKSGGTFDLEPVNGEHQKFYDFVKGLINSGKLKALNTLEDFNFTLKWTHTAKMNTNEKPLIIKP